MAALKWLDLKGNLLVGTVPPSWGRWKNILDTDLRNNSWLTGCLPPAWKLRFGRHVEHWPGLGEIDVTPVGLRLILPGTGITGYC
jgi:hypothetical protein